MIILHIYIVFMSLQYMQPIRTTQKAHHIANLFSPFHFSLSKATWGYASAYNRKRQVSNVLKFMCSLPGGLMFHL